MRSGVLVLALTFLVAAQYVVEMPVDVVGGNCVVGYLPPKFSDSVKHEGGVLYLWADRPVEVNIYASGSVQQSSGAELRLEVGTRDMVMVRNPHNTGVVYAACRGEPRLPIGLADYGIAMTNPPVAYSYETREVRGFVSIRNYVPGGSRDYSLQLNVMTMVVTEKGVHYYWLQNTFTTHDKFFKYQASIWNVTGRAPGLRYEAIRGRGELVPYDKDWFYGYVPSVFELRYPISTALYIRVGLSVERFPWFAFGYDLGSGVVWYDNVTLLVRAKDVKIVVKPPREARTPSGHPLNIELVLGGPNGTHPIAEPRELDITLRLEYWNGTAYVPPPFLYNFGAVTAEMARGVSVAYLGGGSARLSAGVFRPALLYSGYVPVRVVDADGAKWFAVRNGTLLDLRRPPVVYVGNKTRVLYFGNSLGADAVAATRPLNVTYSFRREHLVAVRDWNGTAYRWVAEEAVIAYEPGDVYLSNGTRLAVSQVYIDGAPAGKTVKTTVAKPTEISVARVRQYLIRLIAPVNSTEAWADEGSVFKVGLADPWDLPNGTRFAGLLINGTAQRDFRVERPMTLRAQYAEVYYWAVVETPVNKTVGWMPKDTVLKFPDIINFGNGTRLIKPSIREVVVKGPVALKVEYAKRQHYVKIEGVNRWEGWADAGSVIRLNATVVGGVEYTPVDETDAVVVTVPGVYRPLFYAVYRTVARDVLGMPNPLATVKLCNATAQAGLAGFVVVETYTRDLCQPAVEAFPISPYTAAGAAAPAATAVAFALKKRRK